MAGGEFSTQYTVPPKSVRSLIPPAGLSTASSWLNRNPMRSKNCWTSKNKPGVSWATCQAVRSSSPLTGYQREGRTADAWAASLSQTWVKLRLTKATAMANGAPLKDPMSLRGGPGGEVARYLMEAGDLAEELMILNEIEEDPRRAVAENTPSLGTAGPANQLMSSSAS